MAGMEGLGRFNVIPIAAGNAFNFSQASGAMVVCTGNDTFTLKSASSFAGSYTNLAVITRYYTNTATNGTAGWVAATQAAAATVTQSSGTTVFHVLTSQLSDPADYLKVTVGASGLVAVFLYDLNVQRAPANLLTPGA
jgi:hypothetical protein